MLLTVGYKFVNFLVFITLVMTSLDDSQFNNKLSEFFSMAQLVNSFSNKANCVQNNYFCGLNLAVTNIKSNNCEHNVQK